MQQRSISKLYKILTLEANLNYADKAVVGGLAKIIDTWQGEARADNLPEDKISSVVNKLNEYTNLTPIERSHALKTIGHILENAGIKNLPSFSQQPKIEQTSITSNKESDASKPHVKTVVQSRVSAQKRSSGPSTIPNTAINANITSPTTSVRGIGNKQAQLLEKLGLFTVEDMVYFFPRRYDDYSEFKFIKDLKYGEEVTIVAWIKSINAFTTQNKARKIIQVLVSDDTGSIQLIWFNQAYQLRYLREKMFLSISGKVDQNMGRLVIYHPEYEQVDKTQLHTKRIVPIYPLTARLGQRWLRRVMYGIVNDWIPLIPEFMPEYILKDANLSDLSTALREIHFPENQINLKNARFRLAFDEIFLLQIGVLRQKHEWTKQIGRKYDIDEDWLNKRIDHLPYQLTSAQNKALMDLKHDLTTGGPMNRLLQGDVGSGKTVVSALGISIVVKTGAQAAYMAPTSILAEQHFNSLKQLLADPKDLSSVLEESEIRLLIGDTPAKEREQILAELSTGKIKLLVGTHALIEDPVIFKDLQIIVVDEQHRFGVTQRAALRDKGENPHLLVMTATPIPRSLALTIYGDLDLTVIDEMPPGRQPVSTHIVYPTERERTYRLVESQVEKGHQAFFIYPLVEQGENDEVLAAVQEQERLQNDVFPNLRVGLLHGRLRPNEKESIMRQFRDQAYDILVSTTVIEVGVDIPNATVMVVEGANRFGLAQLHQLRGRVGRGANQSYCLLIPQSNDAAENKRLLSMESTNDGFVLAEHDLNQRGPGEFLGTRQSGYANLRLASLTDVKLIEKARKYAQQVFENDPTLTAPEHQLLVKALNHFWPHKEGDVS